MHIYRNIDRSKFAFDFLCTSSLESAFDSEIKELGGNIYNYEKFSSKKILKVIKDTVKIMKEHGPYDIVHIPLQFYSGIFCIAAKKAGIKTIIVHSHNANDNTAGLRKVYIFFMRKIINRLSDIRLACGEDAGKFLFGNKKDFKVIYNGIDLEKYKNINKDDVKELKKKYNINDELVIGHIGRFTSVKNQVFFVEIAKEFKKTNKNVKIVLIGIGDKLEEVKNKVKANNLDDMIIFTGLQSDIPLYASMFDVFVMPSLYEGFPVSIIEVLAAGVPCVVSDTITQEVNAIKNSVKFISLNDEISIWCNEILEMSKIKFNVDDNCKVLTEKGFSVKSTVKKLTEIYEGIKTNE